MPEFVYKRPVEELEPLKPLITILLVFMFLCVFGFSFQRGLTGAQLNAFTGARFAEYLSSNDYVKLISMMFNATFNQVAFAKNDILHSALGVLQGVFNMYFVWVFGSLVEIRLGYLRYMAVLVAAMLVGWFCLGMEVGVASTPYFVGPAFLTGGILGAYLNFLPVKKIPQGGNIGRSYKVIVTESLADPSKAFEVSPWKLFGFFFIWQIALHFLISFMGASDFDNGRLLSLIAAVVTGLIVSVILIMLAAPSVEGHPLQRLAMIRYRELRKIDLTHDQAITGTARLLSLPDETVKEWLQTARSGLPPIG